MGMSRYNPTSGRPEAGPWLPAQFFCGAPWAEIVVVWDRHHVNRYPLLGVEIATGLLVADFKCGTPEFWVHGTTPQEQLRELIKWGLKNPGTTSTPLSMTGEIPMKGFMVWYTQNNNTNFFPNQKCANKHTYDTEEEAKDAANALANAQGIQKIVVVKLEEVAVATISRITWDVPKK